MPDLVTALRAEIASLEHQNQTWKALVDHMRGVQEAPLLTVVADGAAFRVAMTWDRAWEIGEWSVLLATVLRHVAHNTDIEEEQLLFAIDHALDHMDGERINGGRVM